VLTNKLIIKTSNQRDNISVMLANYSITEIVNTLNFYNPNPQKALPWMKTCNLMHKSW